MPNESGQVNSPETDNPAGLNSAGEPLPTIEVVLSRKDLTGEEYDAVLGTVELLRFASQYLPKEGAINANAPVDSCHVIANYEAVEVDGRIRYTPTCRNGGSETPRIDPVLAQSVLAIENLFVADLSDQFQAVKVISESGVYGSSLFQRALQYVDNLHWTPEKSIAGRSRKVVLDGKRLEKIEQSIHLRQNSLKLVKALKVSLVGGFDPVEFHYLVFKVNSYLLNLLMERYGKG